MGRSLCLKASTCNARIREPQSRYASDPQSRPLLDPCPAMPSHARPYREPCPGRAVRGERGPGGGPRGCRTHEGSVSTGRPGVPFESGSERTKRAASLGGQTTAAQRRAARQPWCGTILDLMNLAGMVGESWRPWRSFWKACYAIPTTPDELAIFRQHTGRETPPTLPVAEAWMVIGRGGGKTRNSALHAVYRAITFDPKTVAPGEDVVIPLLASDRRQARAALKYVRGFTALPAVGPYVFRGTLKERAEFRTGCDVEVVTASKAAPRGFTCPTACCDEIAWWETEDDHTNPDHEILTAVRGSLGRIADSLLVVLSNPGAPRGELFEAVEAYYGRDADDVLVWNADTLSMNPGYDRRTIERAFARDPTVALSEFGAEGKVSFRQARAAMFDEDAVRACIITDRRELPPVEGVRYVAFVDAAQGQRSGDAMTLGIAHGDGSRAVLDLMREVEPPFNPAAVVEVFADICHAYGVREVVGDRVSIGFVLHEFEVLGLRFTPSKLRKSDLFAELLPLINTSRCELLDHAGLRGQLLALERRSVRGGRDQVDHPRGAHDDLANSAAGALVHVTGVGQKPRRRVIISMGGDSGGTFRYDSRQATPGPDPRRRAWFRASRFR
jgi:hypothetical protein